MTQTIDEIFEEIDSIKDVDFALEMVTVELADGEKATIPKIELLDLQRQFGEDIGSVLY